MSSIEDTMNKPQFIIAFLVLKMNLQPVTTKVLLHPERCPSCPKGYFLKENCTITPKAKGGIRCAECTSCAALDQETLIACSRKADSVCGPKTTTSLPPTVITTEATNKATNFAPYQWIIPFVIVSSLVLVILVSLFLTLLSCRFPHFKNREVSI